MRRIKRSILRAQGRMARVNPPHPVRYLRSWCLSIVGSERNPSTPGAGNKFRKNYRGTGKQRARVRRSLRRHEMVLLGGTQ